MLKELYLFNPIERDANEFAINELWTIFKDSSEKQKELKVISELFYPPLKIFAQEKENKLFGLFCEIVELAYKNKISRQKAIYSEIEKIIEAR